MCNSPRRRCALIALWLTLVTPPGIAIDIQGHRGARGLAPENTLPAFRRALTEGVSTLELDVGMTRGGVVVIHHDASLNPMLTRGRDGRWIDAPILLSGLSLARLRRFDVGRVRPDTEYAARFARQAASDGATVPTLSSLFSMVRSRGDHDVRFNIETKISPLAPSRTAAPEIMLDAILRTIAQHGMHDRVMLQSFDWRTLALAQKRSPSIPTVYLTSRQSGFDNVAPHWNAGLALADHGSVPRMVKAAGGWAWSPFHGDLTAADLAQARTLGLKVIPWTVNSEEAIGRVLDLDVDGLVTDYPDLARAIVQTRGLRIGPLNWDARASR